jgi:hypothetical protein
VKERHGFVNETGEAAVVTLPVNGRPTPLDVSEPLKAACSAIVKPIVDAVRDMIGGSTRSSSSGCGTTSCSAAAAASSRGWTG